MEVLALAVILRLLFYAINYMLFWCSEIFFFVLLLCVCVGIICIPSSICRESTKCIIFVLRGCMMLPYLKERCVIICFLIY
jgi:hypothetical protein